MTACSTHPGRPSGPGPRGRSRSASMPPPPYLPRQRWRLARLTPRARAAPMPCSRAVRTHRMRNRSPARSSVTPVPGGRPPRVARNRNPGPSWYVCRWRRRCGSARLSVSGRSIGPRYRPLMPDVSTTPGTTPSRSLPDHHPARGSRRARAFRCLSRLGRRLRSGTPTLVMAHHQAPLAGIPAPHRGEHQIACP